MATNLFNTFQIFNNINAKTLVKSAKDATAVELPRFIAGDKIPISYTLLEEQQDNIDNPFKIITPDSYTLKIGMFNPDDGSTLALQNSFDNNTTKQSKESYLDLATQQISDFLGNAQSKSVIFEIEITDSNGNITTAYQNTVKLYKDYIKQNMISVPAGEQAATITWALGTFVKLNPTVFQPLTFVSPNGNKFAMYIDDDGTLKINRIG